MISPTDPVAVREFMKELGFIWSEANQVYFLETDFDKDIELWQAIFFYNVVQQQMVAAQVNTLTKLQKNMPKPIKKFDYTDAAWHHGFNDASDTAQGIIKRELAALREQNNHYVYPDQPNKQTDSEDLEQQIIALDFHDDTGTKLLLRPPDMHKLVRFIEAREKAVRTQVRLHVLSILKAEADKTFGNIKQLIYTEHQRAWDELRQLQQLSQDEGEK